MAREIPICRNNIQHRVVVDDDDYPLLSRHTWHLLQSGDRLYAYASVYTGKGVRKMVPMTHMIMGSWYHVDHVDNNPLNNQKYNLRPATHQQNGWNRGKPRRVSGGRLCSSQYKGVRRVDSKTKGTRWLAYLKYVETGMHKSTGKMIYIGYFATEIEAARAYNVKVRELRGEWAWLNPVPDLPYECTTVQEDK